MTGVFAITTRGLEGISADEMNRLPGLHVSHISYRRVSADYTGELDKLLGLRTIDDVFLDLATWEAIATQRSVLADITRLAGKLKLAQPLEAIAQLRPLKNPPVFSVTANFVGKRNYNTAEIKESIGIGISRRYGWQYTSEDESEINIRAFIEHDRAYIGMRLAVAPLHRRRYKQSNLPGSLKPTVAAAMLIISGVYPGESVLDPLCGAGTILIEAALSGIEAYGGDNDPQALAAARDNAALAGVTIQVEPWDTRNLPLENHSVRQIVTNFPWGKQVEIGGDIASFYEQVCTEIERVLTSNGQVVVLTCLPHLLSFKHRSIISQTEISLFGQTPSIIKFAAA